MSDTSGFPTKQDVIDALAEFKIGRTRGRAYQVMRSILRQYGDGARNIHELDPKFYAAVYAAAGGVRPATAEEFYGVAADVSDAPPPETSPADHYGVVLDVLRSELTTTGGSIPAKIDPSPLKPILRLRTPLTADLEARLAAAKAKTRRSFPGSHVNLGDASRPEDQADDVARDFPAGERVR